MITLLPSLWSIAALAEPRFVGADGDVALARAAWAGAARCTGREGLALDDVPLVRRVLPGAYLGVARTEPGSGVLQKIELNTDGSPDRDREVVVHEVTHAWVSEGPVALVEGVAELIADCVVTGDPALAPHQFDDGRDLDGMPDLVAWSAPVEGIPSELYAVRTDAYVGAARLLRTAAAALAGDGAPPSDLWASRTVSWSAFTAELSASGPRGQAVVAMLDGGARAQAAALSDADHDGLTALVEGWLRTDPDAYDTDGDGWWDGVDPRGIAAGAKVVPLDLTPVCAGRATEGDGALGSVGGTLRGVDHIPLRMRRLPGDGDRPVLAWLGASVGADVTGGVWVVPTESASGPGCASDRAATVWAEDPGLADRVSGFAAALARAEALANARYGPGPQRFAVALGGAHTTFDAEVVWLSSADVEAAIARDGDAGLDALALLAVSVRRLWSDGERDWPAAEAVARSLALSGPGWGPPTKR